jgi:hypothetical protein
VTSPKSADGKSVYTFVLSEREFQFLLGSGKIEKMPVGAPFFFRRLWRQCAKIRALLDLAAPLSGAAPDNILKAISDPLTARYSGRGAYFALLEQAIVASVSAWEAFASETIRDVLNDRMYVAKLTDLGTQPLRSLTSEFQLTEEIVLELISRRFDFTKARLGDTIVDSRRIRWQDLDDCKRVFRILFPDVDFRQMARDWAKVTKLFEDRHRIVHASGTGERQAEDYDVDEEKGTARRVLVTQFFEVATEYDAAKVEQVLADIVNIALGLHARLFARFSANDLGAGERTNDNDSRPPSK